MLAPCGRGLILRSPRRLRVDLHGWWIWISRRSLSNLPPISHQFKCWEDQLLSHSKWRYTTLDCQVQWCKSQPSWQSSICKPLPTSGACSGRLQAWTSPTPGLWGFDPSSKVDNFNASQCNAERRHRRFRRSAITDTFGSEQQLHQVHSSRWALPAVQPETPQHV